MFNISTYKMAVIKMIIATMCWGGTFIAVRSIANFASPALVGFMRFFIASITLIIVLEIQKKSILKQKISIKDFFELFILALSGIFAYNMFFVMGLELIPASRASLIVANNPIAIAIGAVIFFKERLKAIQIIGICLSMCGAIIVLTDGNLQELAKGLSYGDLIIFGCVISWAVYSLVGKLVLKRLSPLLAVTWASILGTILFLPLAHNDLTQNFASLPNIVFYSVLYLGIFGTAIGFVFFYEVMNVLGATKTGIYISFVPVFATLFSILLLGEKISISFILAGVLTLTGVYLVNKK